MKKTTIFAAILMLAITFMMVAPLPSEAQTNVGQYLPLPISFTTFTFMDAAPDPVGVGQTIYLSVIMSKPLPTSQALNGDMYADLTIKVTDPNGVVTTLGPHDGGMIGGWATTYTPTVVGEYQCQAFYPGQVLTGTNPYNSNPGGYHAELRGSTALPSNSTVRTFTVQTDPVTSIYQTPPLPTQYWTRPVNALNWLWGADVASNWLGLDATGFCVSGKYDATGGFQPYGTGPNTAHILWSKSTREGGQPGGPIGSDPTTAYSTTSVVINMYDGMIIMNGIGYYTLHYGYSGTVYGWQAVDLKTGAVIWEKPAGITGAESLKCGQIFNFHSAQQYGSIAMLYTTTTSAGRTSSDEGSIVRVYDAWTGNLMMNLTNARNLAMISADPPTKSNTGQYTQFEQQGGLLGWFIESGSLKRWNSTKLYSTVNAQGVGSTAFRVSTMNWTNGIDQIIPLPADLNTSLSIGAITKECILLRFCPGFYYQANNLGWQVTMGIDAVTGKTLWGPLNQTLPIYQTTGVESAKEGVYVIQNKDVNELSGYSLTTGGLLWGPVKTLGNANTPLDCYNDIAYGKVFQWDMGGIVQAYDLNTGARLWNWSRGSAGYDDPRGIYELFGYRAHSIADGKLFLQEGVMYTPPLHPARRTVLNCTDGTLVWDILSYEARSGSPVADGVLVGWDSYDAKIYAYGQGPTQTTVSAPGAGVPFGSAVTITGSVIDISAGTKQEGVIENFPSGVPAVSDASVTQWMEYVYKQQIKPSNTTGVDVTINVLDANNNYRPIGTATSDANGVFSLAYTPDIAGAYKVYAVFSGSQAYYGSTAESAFTVNAAPETTMAPTPVPASLADQYLLPATGGIIVAIVLVGVVLALLLRKR